jgi:hypothetical protein
LGLPMQRRKFITISTGFILIATHLTQFSPAAISSNVTPKTITTCTEIETGKTIVLRSALKQCRAHLTTAIWTKVEVDSTLPGVSSLAALRICTSKNPAHDYQLVKSKCNRYHITTDYWRAISKPEIPEIISVSAQGHDGALFSLRTSTFNANAPISHYIVTNLKTGNAVKVPTYIQGELSVTGLSPLTTYSFQIAAVNVDGQSANSLATKEITTGARPVAASVSSTSVAMPAFTISANAETKTVNSAITGYLINSTGGTISSYSITPSIPSGLLFSSSTGLLSGTPTTSSSATVYTITGTNASGSATQSFTLTVSPVIYTVGQTGPGGGTIFYYNSAGFACGISLTSTCNYLEVAPDSNFRRLNWSSTSLQNTSTLNSTGTAIGTGHRNTALVVAAGATESTTSAIACTDQYVSPNGTSDWFLPSKDEMTSLSDANAANLLGGFFLNPSDHWTSSQSTSAANQVWIDLNPGTFEWYKNSDNFLIPVRAG